MNENLNVKQIPYYNFLPEICSKYGYSRQVSSWNRNDLSRMTFSFTSNFTTSEGCQMEFVVNEKDVWQILIGESSVEIIHAKEKKSNYRFCFLDEYSDLKYNTDKKDEYYIYFELKFNGNIRTEAEFINIMDAIGAPVKL